MRRLCSAAVSLASIACAAPSTPDYGPAIAELERLIPELMRAADVPGLSIALVDGPETVWLGGFGHTDRTGARPVTGQTTFSLQSISKTYTAIGVLLAVESGRLGLDDPLVRHLPDFSIRSRFGDDEAGRITIRHLLSHWAGLPHEAPVGGNFDQRPTTFERHVESIADAWLMSPVGFRYSYSNLGPDLAGYVLERLTGQPFAEYVRAALFEPLGMTASTFDEALARRRTDLARGHAGDREVPDLQIAIVPSGGMYSTARDMARFVSFMLAGGAIDGRTLLAPELLDQMATPQLGFERPGGYGLGLSVRPMAGATLLAHGGDGYGYATMQAWIPEHRVGVVVLSNQHSSIAYELADSALRKMVRAKLGQVPPDPPVSFDDAPEVEPDPAVLSRLAGSYKRRSSLIRFAVVDGALHADSTRLVARGPTTFSGPGVRYRFALGPDGAPRGVEMTSCCGLEYWPYNDGPGDPPGPNRAWWATVVGSYRAPVFGGFHPMEVSVRRGYLYLDWGGGQRLREHAPRLYFTPDGESVRFLDDRVEVGNRPFSRIPR
ncbi:MAG: serine hydrolase domain-containing protein [Gemmatimonadales bacterium]